MRTREDVAKWLVEFTRKMDREDGYGDGEPELPVDVFFERYPDWRAYWLKRADELFAFLEPLTSLESDVIEWQDKTFPGATTHSVFLHLQEEQRELRNLVYPSEWGVSRAAIKNEIGDNGLLLMALSKTLGFTFEEAMRDKFETARERTYEYDSALGYAKHVD